MTNNQLHSKVAIITGAGRGIGKAIALAYAQAGAAVVCTARTAGEIEQTVREIEQTGGRGLALPTDVTDLAAVERMCAVSAETFGGFDIVVINAGVSLEKGMVEASDPDDWRATLEVNLFGAYNCARTVIPHLKARGGGKIITVGSGMGRHGRPGSSAYSCSKAALWMLTRVLAQELWPYNISVNELIPGPVDTAMTVDPAARQGPAFASESEWIKRPEDVAPLALFLATQPTIGPTAQSFSLMRRDG